MNVEALERLANVVLPQVPDENFDLKGWECGTVKCAVGWACVDPWFNDQGLYFKPDYDEDLIPVYKDKTNWKAIKEFFNIDLDTSLYLFSEDTYKTSPSKQDVINRINEVLSGVK